MNFIVDYDYTKKSKNKKTQLNVLSLLAIAMCLLTTEDSWATCSAPSSTVKFPGPIVVQRDSPIGTILATTKITTNVTCNNVGNPYELSWSLHLSASNADSGASSVSDVRLTSTPGVGIRWINNNSQTGTNLIWSARSLNDASVKRGMKGNGVTTLTDTFELVKVSDVPLTTSPSFTLKYAYLNPSGAEEGSLMTFNASAQSMQVVACTVTTPSITVAMGDVKKTIFTGVGSSAQDRNVVIPLNCDAGTKVNVTLDGNRHSSGAKGVLELNSSSGTVATGVGLQLLYNSTPVTLGTPIAVGAAVGGGVFSIPLIARYYQTAATITEGEANSTATFTMTYN